MHGRWIVVLVTAAAAWSLDPLASDGAGSYRPAIAHAAEGAPSWRAEFDEICGRTQDAMALGDAELKSLVERADKLLAAIEKLDEAERKVFTRRLKACRDLFVFVLTTRERS